MLKLHLRDQKWSEKSIGDFWPSLTSPKQLNPEQQTCTLCHKMKPPYITMFFLSWKINFKGTIYLLFKDSKLNLMKSRFPETLLFTSQKILCPHTRTYIFAQWTLIQDKTLTVQSQSHQRLKANFVTVVTANSNRDKLFKMIQFRTVLSEVKIILLWI